MKTPFDHSDRPGGREETKEERCQRVLSGKLGHKLKRASEMQFDYDSATALARHHPNLPAKAANRTTSPGGP